MFLHSSSEVVQCPFLQFLSLALELYEMTNDIGADLQGG